MRVIELIFKKDYTELRNQKANNLGE